MKYRLIFTEKAISDTEKQKDWYERKQMGLGTRFLDAIFDTIEVIRSNPEGYQSKFRYTRELLVRKFPFVVIYSIEEKTIFILRIFPCKRNPARKYRKQ